MKKEWRTSPLGEACPISNRKPEEFAGKRRYFSTGAVGPEGELSEPEMVDFATRPSRAGCMPRVGDIGFARMKGTKKVILIGESLKGSLFSTGFCFISPQPNLDSRFAFYFVTSDAFQDAKNEAAGEGIMGGIKNGDAAVIRVPLPPLLEQERIADLLHEAFVGLATAKTNAEKNIQNVRALFESHLQSVFSQRGEGWAEKRLVEVSLEFGRGKSKHRPRNEPSLYDGPYPFIQTGDISNADHWLTEHTQTYSELGLAQSRLWPKGTICIAIVGATVGETAILDFEACFPDSVIGVVVNDQLADTEYVEFLLQSFKALLKEKGQGTARDNINLGTFENQTFPFPELKRQKQIVATLNALRAETQRLESIYQQKLVALGALKKSLLHQAFGGKL